MSDDPFADAAWLCDDESTKKNALANGTGLMSVGWLIQIWLLTTWRNMQERMEGWHIQGSREGEEKDKPTGENGRDEEKTKGGQKPGD